MAVFLERGRHGGWFEPPAATGNVFTDIGPDSYAASFIEHLAGDRITSGCGQNRFCPDRTVTRDQMAVFLLRSKYGSSYTPPAPSGVFNDVPVEYWAAGWIEQLAVEGITGGCGNNNFCPNDSVTRDQMAVFLVRTFELEVDNTAVLTELGLAKSSLDQAFLLNTLEYTANVGYLASQVSVIATSHPEALNIQVNGVWTVSGVPSEPVKLNEGDNQITVTVHGRSGATRDYTISVTRQSASEFAQLAYVKGENTSSHELLGSSVAIDHDTLAVGAPFSNSSGAVLVFVRNEDGVWSQQGYLQASNGALDDRFGTSVSISGDRIAVGAPRVDVAGSNSGAAYLFVRDDSGVWQEEQFIRSGKYLNNQDDYFGHSVSLDSDTLVVGAPYDDGLGTDAGLVYIFHRDVAGFWQQKTAVGAHIGSGGNNLGFSVSLSGDTLAVGVPGDDSNATGINGDKYDESLANSGAVYLYSRTDGVWNGFVSGYIKPSFQLPSSRFGYSVSLSGSQLAVGAPYSFSQSGAALVFENTGGVWSQSAFLTASNPDEFDNFGISVSVDDGNVVIGAAGEDSSAVGVSGDQSNGWAVNSGAVYVFLRSDIGEWNQSKYLKASNTDSNDNFGSSVALSFDTIAVGAINEDSSASGINDTNSDNNARDAGAVYVFR
jgi:hypothetical protein